MKDYLTEYSSQLDIQLIYHQNKYTVLSTGISKDQPTIRAHRVFQNCPRSIARSIVDYYYMDYKYIEKYLPTIKQFLDTQFNQQKYIIKPPSERFKQCLISRNSPKQDKVDRKPMMELNIYRIVKKNFHGEISEINPKESIKATSDDVVELDIMIHPFNTKNSERG